MILRTLPLAASLATAIFTAHPALAAPAVPRSEGIDQAGWNKTKKSIRLPNGLRLAYQELGNPAGRPLLLLHGYSDSSRAFSTLVPSLGEFRLIIPDQRGHGASEAPRCCYAVSDFANDARLLLDALGVEKTAVAGHSLGSVVAMQLAADSPDRVTALTLIGSTALAPVKRGDWLWTATRALKPPIASNTEFLKAWSASAGPVTVDPEFVRYSDAEFVAVPPHVWDLVIRELVDVPAGRHAADIKAPVLILSGGKDEIFPAEHHEALVRTFPGARARIFPELGHNLVWERPDEIAGEIADFLNR